jgi:hypothetical protein
MISEAVHGLRALGFAFIGIDFLLMIPIFLGDRSLPLLVLAGSAAMVLLAPGAVYQVAAFSVRHKEIRSAELAQRAASAQMVLIVLGTAIGIARDWMLGNTFWRTSSMYGSVFFTFALPVPAMWFPPLIGAFFLPALLAQMWNIRSAIAAIRALPEERRGFEAIPMAMLAPGNMPMASGQASVAQGDAKLAGGDANVASAVRTEQDEKQG